MKLRLFYVLTAITLTGASFIGNAQDQPAQPVLPNRPNLEELRQELRSLSPEERQAYLTNLRNQRPAAPEHSPGEAVQSQASEERNARIQALRDKRATPEQANVRRHEQFKSLSPEEREARLKGIRERTAAPRGNSERDPRLMALRRQQAELLEKKETGTLTPEEERHLNHLEAIQKRFDQRQPAPRPPVVQPEKPANLDD